jgi:hypothetical protein
MRKWCSKLGQGWWKLEIGSGKFQHHLIYPLLVTQELSWRASISKLLEARLEENGYSDELRDMAKGKSLLVKQGWADELETARNQDDPNITTLIETITPKAKG